MKELRGKRVLITGAASGIGRALAHAFAAEGSSVVAVDINGEGCRAVAAEVEGACAYTLDVTDAAAAIELAGRVEAEVGPLDILVNCAGIVIMGDIVDTSLKDWHRIMDINLWGPIHLINAFLPGMYERKSGHVVNICSGAGLFPLPTLGAYVTTKFALVGLSETLYMEARGHGVGVTAICPWGVITPIMEGVEAYNVNESRKEKLFANIKPFLKTPEHVAARVIRAVKKDRPVYMHTAFGGFMDVWHRVSRLAYLYLGSITYKHARRLISQ